MSSFPKNHHRTAGFFLSKKTSTPFFRNQAQTSYLIPICHTSCLLAYTHTIRSLPCFAFKLKKKLDLGASGLRNTTVPNYN